VLSIRSAISNRKVTKLIHFNASLGLPTGPKTKNDGAAETIRKLLIYSLQSWSWSEQKYGYGTLRGPKPRVTVLAKARRNCIFAFCSVNLGTNKHMIMGLDGVRNQERLCWRRPVTNYCPALLCSLNYIDYILF
jgi:hypothetical protein